MPEDALLVFSTFGNVDEARRVGRQIVEEHLAACVNIVPAIESIYRWQGAIETAGETLAIFKTNIDRYYQLEARLKELHSYEVPEVVALRAHAGLLPYLRWIDDSCQGV